MQVYVKTDVDAWYRLGPSNFWIGYTMVIKLLEFVDKKFPALLITRLPDHSFSAPKLHFLVGQRATFKIFLAMYSIFTIYLTQIQHTFWNAGRFEHIRINKQLYASEEFNNNNNFIKNTILVCICVLLSNGNASNRGYRLPKKFFDRFQIKGDALSLCSPWFYIDWTTLA